MYIHITLPPDNLYRVGNRQSGWTRHRCPWTALQHAAQLVSDLCAADRNGPEIKLVVSPGAAAAMARLALDCID